MIIGTGVDILDIRRIEGIIFRQGQRFIQKIYTLQEQNFCRRRLRKTESFAKIFAVKEAVIKAISDVSGIFWKDIEVFHDINGKPFVKLRNAALSKFKNQSFSIEISVSDEPPYVCAFAIIETIS